MAGNVVSFSRPGGHRKKRGWHLHLFRAWLWSNLTSLFKHTTIEKKCKL